VEQDGLILGLAWEVVITNIWHFGLMVGDKARAWDDCLGDVDEIALDVLTVRLLM